jgi:hypothetical protein
MAGTRQYRELLGLPSAAALVAWSLLGPLPLGMAPLSLLLLLRGEGRSYGVVVASRAPCADGSCHPLGRAHASCI